MSTWRTDPLSPPPLGVITKADPLSVHTADTTQDDGSATPSFELVSPVVRQILQTKDKELETLTLSW